MTGAPDKYWTKEHEPEEPAIEAVTTWAATEDERKTLGSADPRLLELSREAELIAKRLVPKAVAERALAIETRK